MITKKNAPKGKIDLITIKKIFAGVVVFVASYYLLNVDVVNEFLANYISNPQTLAVVTTFLLYIADEASRNYSK